MPEKFLSKFKIIGQIPTTDLPVLLRNLHSIADRMPLEVAGGLRLKLAFPESHGMMPAPASRGGLGVIVEVIVPTAFVGRVAKQVSELSYRITTPEAL